MATVEFHVDIDFDINDTPYTFTVSYEMPIDDAIVEDVQENPSYYEDQIYEAVNESILITANIHSIGA